jgi:sugar/nucleoside kinase (ribokinase family)
MHKRLAYVEELIGNTPNVIHISHLQNLNLPNSMSNHTGSRIIKEIFQNYGGKTVISFNPGSSQIQHGIRYWEKELGTLSVLQLNMSEAKQFFSVDGLSTSLVDMINWFRAREISVVITLDKFGAVGSYRTGKDGIIFAWPIELSEHEMVDPTGAGDAFAAGFISEICAKTPTTFHDFYTAVDTGRYWSAYACTTLGGAGDCPSAATISKFRTRMERQIQNPIEVISQAHAERELRLIDKAFE